jgi:hypothetical protein
MRPRVRHANANTVRFLRSVSDPLTLAGAVSRERARSEHATNRFASQHAPPGCHSHGKAAAPRAPSSSMQLRGVCRPATARGALALSPDRSTPAHAPTHCSDPCNSVTAAVISRTRGALLLSCVQASVAESRRRTPVPDEDQASASARSAPASLLHLWKGSSAAVASAAVGRALDAGPTQAAASMATRHDTMLQAIAPDPRRRRELDHRGQPAQGGVARGEPGVAPS